MSNNNSSSTGAGIGFPGLLTLLFIALKLTHVIGWSWLWVLSPLWIAALVAVAILLIILIGALIAVVFSKPKPRRR